MLIQKIQEGYVVASDDGLFLLVLGKNVECKFANQWLCLVLGDFYSGFGAEPLEPGCLDVFSIRNDRNTTWVHVSP